MDKEMIQNEQIHDMNILTSSRSTKTDDPKQYLRSLQNKNPIQIVNKYSALTVYESKTWRGGKQEPEYLLSNGMNIQEGYLDFLITVAKKWPDFMENANMLKVIEKVYLNKNFWIKTPNEIVRKKHNVEEALIAFIQELYCKYAVSKHWIQLFINMGVQYEYFFNKNNVQVQITSSVVIEWIIALGNGVSIRKIEKMPVLTNKQQMALYNKMKLEPLNGKQLFLYAKAKGCGCNDFISKELSLCTLSPIEQHFDGEFWNQVFFFFSAQEFLNPSIIRPLIDYIANERAKDVNYSMKGRSINALMKSMEDWHQELNAESRQKSSLKNNWEHSNYASDYLDIKEDTYFQKINETQICQILDSNALAKEGRAMHHCVFSYLQSTSSGNCDIWSYSSNGERIATIESKGKAIVQIRGKWNERLNKKQMEPIYKWAESNSLRISAC